MVQGAPRGLSGSVLNAVLKFGQIRGSEASAPSVPPHSTACLAEIRPYPPERPSSPLAHSLFSGNLSPFAPGWSRPGRSGGTGAV